MNQPDSDGWRLQAVKLSMEGPPIPDGKYSEYKKVTAEATL
jgi:hypothetical protein